MPLGKSISIPTPFAQISLTIPFHYQNHTHPSHFQQHLESIPITIPSAIPLPLHSTLHTQPIPLLELKKEATVFHVFGQTAFKSFFYSLFDLSVFGR